jgi:hypothetical protein
MQTATQLQKEPPKTTNIGSGISTANPLQLKQPANNPLQFTREQAKLYGFKVDVDLVEYFKDERIMTSRKLLFILINNHELSEDDADYIDLENAKTMIPDYDEDSLSDATVDYLGWVAAKEKQEKKKSKKEKKTQPDKDKEHMGVLPTLTLGDRNITLIGTLHGDDKPDYSGDITGDIPNDTDIVLEYPSLTDTDRDQYTSDDIGKVRDNTQASLAKSANGRKVIGGDGRKAFDQKQILHSISTRNKEATSVEIIDKYMEDEEIQKLAINYVYAALGLNETDAEAVSIPIEKLVKYLDGTFPLLVLINTFNQVRKLSKKLSPDIKAVIAGKVIQTLDQDLTGLKESYASHIKKGKKQLAAIQSDQEREKEQSKIEKATQLEFTGNKISFLHDVVCNILLFTEVIASDKNMVVAFGAHHIIPLKELIEEVANPINSTSSLNMSQVNKEEVKGDEKMESSQSAQTDLKKQLHQLILKFLQIEMNANPLGINNCLIEAILNKLNIGGEARGLIIEKIRRSLDESGIPKGEMLHATAGVLNLIAHEIYKATGITIGTVTVHYKHISNEIQKNIEHMDNTLLNNLLDNITDDIPIGNGQDISITHTGFAHFK